MKSSLLVYSRPIQHFVLACGNMEINKYCTQQNLAATTLFF